MVRRFPGFSSSINLIMEATTKDIDTCSLHRVDLFIPGVEKVGGFSMTSSPKKLSEEGSLLLAVKYSDHPPAKWVHTQVLKYSD